MDLEERACAGAKCSNKFRVLPTDTQVWCSVFCRDNHEGIGWSTAAYRLRKQTAPYKATEKKPTKEQKRRWGARGNQLAYDESLAKMKTKKRKT